METLVPPGVVIPEGQTVAETEAQPFTQDQIDAINKLAEERGTEAAAALARGLLD